MPSFPRRVAALALACVLSAAPGRSAAAQEMPPAPVRVDAVRREEVGERRRVSGNVRAVDRTRVAAREAGLVVEAAAREALHVKRGDVLARIDDDRIALDLAVLAAQRTTATSAVALRRAELDRERTELQRMERAVKQDVAAARDLDAARDAVRVAEAAVAAAEAELPVLDARAATLRRRAEDCVVRAPFDGVVVARHASPGAWLGEGGAVCDLVAEACEAWLDVPQRDLAALSSGSGEIRITADGATVAATSWRVLPEVDARARTFPVVVPLGAARGLAPGMSVTAWVPTGARAPHLTVASDAILRGETGPYVYVAAPGTEGKPHAAMPVPVEVLFLEGERVVVRSDRLAEGALAVVEGNERLFPSAPVAPFSGTKPR